MEYTSTYSPFQSFTRQEWSSLNDRPEISFSHLNLETLKALGEPLTEEELREVYLPLCRLLQMHVTHHRNLHRECSEFLGRSYSYTPFVIGIAGSVAVGKSTTARVLRKLLSLSPQTPRVDLVTTDGFLLSNEELKARGILEKKGFPESYDAVRLLNFLSAVKSGRRGLQVPLYSHLEYDILVNEYQLVDQPDILIVEGINVLQVNTTPSRPKRRVFVSDFFDFSIFVDADREDIREWYVKRFLHLQNTAFQNPQSYFYRFANLSKEETIEIAHQIWAHTNLPNLEENILPTRFRSDLILKKGEDHSIQGVRLRKI